LLYLITDWEAKRLLRYEIWHWKLFSKYN